MSSDGLTRRACRTCGDWRGVYLDDPPPDGSSVYTPACQRRGLHNRCAITGGWSNHDGGRDGYGPS